MSKLNEQYFETRKKHKESYKKGTSGVAVILLLITIFYFVYNNWEYLNPNSSTLTTEELLTDNKFTVEPLLYVDSLFSVELPEGFFYKPVNEKLRLFAISGDSLNSTSFFVKVEHITTSYQSLTEQWQKQLNETNSDHYVFKLMVLDTLNNVRTELSNVNVQKGKNRMSGLIQLTQIGTTLYIVQGTTLEANRTENEPIITDFINSFEPKQAYNRR